jgi:putative toxin-antitoxin system antitoxin component (TIGR02293 family)
MAVIYGQIDEMRKHSKYTAKNQKAANSPLTVNEPEVAYSNAFSSGVPSISSFLRSKTAPSTIDGVINKHQYISLIRQGVPMQTLLHLTKATDISASEIASILHTSERTLRRYTNDTLLNPEQSERIIELARLFSRGSEVFGSLDSFKTWMNSTIVALGNIKPKELLDTSLGIEILQEELGRIEHGIFA